jgi:hypothetical protein
MSKHYTVDPTGSAISADGFGQSPTVTPLMGPLTAPALPASTVALLNPYGVAVSVYVSGGTVTVIKLGGVTTGLTSGLIHLGAGDNIAITYSSAPSWVWAAA